MRLGSNSEEQFVKTTKKSFLSRFKTLLVISSFLGLGSLNVATLVSDEIHTIGYNVLQRILGSAVADASLTKLLSNSPVVKRKNDASLATSAIEKEKKAMAVANRNLADKYAKLERSHNDVLLKHTTLKAENAKQASIAQNISKKIAARSAKTATRNVSSLAGEAIPFLGTALIVGVTAWDIYDLCETMKDINEINAAFGHPLENEKSVCGMKVPSKEKVLADLNGNWQSAYKSAADSIAQSGTAMAAYSPPSLSWAEMRTAICPKVGSTSPFCR